MEPIVKLNESLSKRQLRDRLLNLVEADGSIEQRRCMLNAYRIKSEIVRSTPSLLSPDGDHQANHIPIHTDKPIPLPLETKYNHVRGAVISKPTFRINVSF